MSATLLPEPLLTLLGSLGVLSLVLGLGYLAATVRAGRLDRQRADLLDEVGLLQTALLPEVPAVVGQVRTSVAYRPSDGPAAGGDFYDAMTLPDGRAAFILGDVCGHGRQALARTAFVRYTLRAYLEAGMEPRSALQVAGTVIDDHMDGEFATAVIAVHDPAQGTLTYASAGHPAPLVAGPARPEAIVAASSPPVGMGLRTGVRQTVLPLPPGSVVCLYTDGLAEARTERGVLGRPRLGDILADMGRDATAAEMLDRVAAEATLVSDDMATMVLVPTAGRDHRPAARRAARGRGARGRRGAGRPVPGRVRHRSRRGARGDRRLPPGAPAPRQRRAGGHLRRRRARGGRRGAGCPPRCRPPCRRRRAAVSLLAALDLDQHLAGVLAVEQAQERVRHVLQALDHGLAVADLPVGHQRADLGLEVAGTGRSGPG